MSSLAFPAQAAAYATGRTIYMLDDSADFCATAKWWLIGLGYHVHDFQDAELALHALASLDAPARERACLLLDVRMPVMSGLQVHDILIERQISGPLARPSLPVIYMTGHGDVPLASFMCMFLANCNLATRSPAVLMPPIPDDWA